MTTCIGENPRLAQPKRLCQAENGCGVNGYHCCLDCHKMKQKTCDNPCHKATLINALGGGCWYLQED